MEEKGIKRNEDGTFAEGKIGGPGRNPMTEEDKLKKKAQKEYIEEYKQCLAEALPMISPVLIAKAVDGDIQAIKEVNDRAIGKAQNNVDITTGGESLNKVLVEFIDGKPKDNKNPDGIPKAV